MILATNNSLFLISIGVCCVFFLNFPGVCITGKNARTEPVNSKTTASADLHKASPENLRKRTTKSTGLNFSKLVFQIYEKYSKQEKIPFIFPSYCESVALQIRQLFLI